MTETKLFVKNLPWSCDEDMLYNTFAEHGEVTFTRLCTDQESGRSRGFGFVSFSDEATAEAAIKKFDNYSLDGRQITVAKAVRREDQPPRDGAGFGGEKVCFSFQKGNCTFGDRCRFAHTGEGAVSSTPRPQGACFAFQRGECTRGDSCKFAHGEETPAAAAAPAEPTNNKRKTFDEEESADEAEETPAAAEKASASEGSDSDSEAAPEPEKKEKKEKKSKKAKVEGETAEEKEARKSAKKAKKAAKKAKK